MNRDQGTDVVDILAGRIIPLRLGYVPVVNRGQRDIEQKKAISGALENERVFFETHQSYKNKAQYCGTPFLARKLNTVSLKTREREGASREEGRRDQANDELTFRPSFSLPAPHASHSSYPSRH